jgi:hypothetical protein
MYNPLAAWPYRQERPLVLLTNSEQQCDKGRFYSQNVQAVPRRENFV